jgi:hypothetical protein
MDTGSHKPVSVSFGRFQVSRHRREFLVDGRSVQIGGRAFDSVAGQRAGVCLEPYWPR